MAPKIVFRKEDNTRESVSTLYLLRPVEMTLNEKYTEEKG